MLQQLGVDRFAPPSFRVRIGPFVAAMLQIGAIETAGRERVEVLRPLDIGVLVEHASRHHVGRVRSAADDWDLVEEVVGKLPRVAAESFALVRVVVGLVGPRAFGEVDAVVVQQRSLLVVHLLDGERVLDQRAIEAALGVGQAALGVEQEIEESGLLVLVGVFVHRFQRGELLPRGESAVVVGLGDDIGSFLVGPGAAQVVRDFVLLLFQDRPFASQQQLGVADGGVTLAEADGELHFDSELPFLKVAGDQIGVGVVELHGLGIGIDQVAAEAAPAIPADGVELGQKEVPRRDQLQLAALDDPLLAAQLASSPNGLEQHFVPVERHAGHGRLGGGTNELSVADRQTGDEPQAPLVGLHAAHAAEGVGARLLDDGTPEGGLHLLFEAVVLFAGLRFLFGLTAAAPCFVQGMNAAPGFERSVACRNFGVEVAVGEVQLPVGVLHVADEITHAGLELGDVYVGVDAGNEHAVDVAGSSARAGDAVVLNASSLHQGMANLGVEKHRPHTGKGVARRVVEVVVDQFSRSELRAGCRPLTECEIKRGQVLLQRAGAAAEELVVDLPVVLFEEGVGRERGVEGAQSSVDAKPRIGIDDGRIVNRGHSLGRLQNQATEIAQGR